MNEGLLNDMASEAARVARSRSGYGSSARSMAIQDVYGIAGCVAGTTTDMALNAKVARKILDHLKTKGVKAYRATLQEFIG